MSTEEQARSGYSLAQQIEALRAYAEQEGYQVFEEVSDRGQSGASLERPGMDRVRDLVAAGGVSMVLAQDRDRIAREPAYHYLLKKEFSEHGTKIRALNDRGDESPEGELTDGILDQLAKFERAKTAERSRRGKLRKAREGKIIASNKINYGFKYNESRDAYVVREEHMSHVKRIFRMIAKEGTSLSRVKKVLELEDIPTPDRGRYWNKKTIREMLLDDVYKPFTFDEIESLAGEGLVSAEVFGRLDPTKNYGIWWFNRRRFVRRHVSEADGNGGRRYRWRQKIVPRPREEWIAVPVPNAGIPREWVDAAREEVKDNRRPSSAGHRFWALSSGIFVCGVCGRRMSSKRQSKGRGYEGWYNYYFCPMRMNKGTDACSQDRGYRAEEVETRIWDLVCALMLEPEHLRDALDAMIEEERRAVRGDPERDAKAWLDRIAVAERKRSGYQDMAAEGLITLDELRAKLAELQELRQTAERELRSIEGRRERLEQLQSDRDSLIGTYTGMAPEALESLSSEECHQLYKILRLRVTAGADRQLAVSGVFGEAPFPSESELARA